MLTIISFVAPVLARQWDPCPDGWVRHVGKCYYFSVAEADWDSSQSYCSTRWASLAGINTLQEMDFMMRSGGPAGYWIGLHREPDKPWKWTNGIEFNNWFPIAGGESCAFMDGSSISSARCSNKQRWICSK